MKRYYDPEYDREITLDKIRFQYEWFINNMGMALTFDDFVAENFDELSDNNVPFKGYWE